MSKEWTCRSFRANSGQKLNNRFFYEIITKTNVRYMFYYILHFVHLWMLSLCCYKIIFLQKKRRLFTAEVKTNLEIPKMRKSYSGK